LKKQIGINAMQLKILAMVFMLCDHLWATIIHGNDWLTCVGRLAFPIFAFMLVEGYFHTRSVRRYAKRLLIAAIVSEIPFNLVSGGSLLYPFHQNVLFTFWLALLVLERVENARNKGRGAWIAALALWGVAGFVGGTLLMVDYYGYGILMILLFYVTRDIPWGRILQFAGMYYINFEMMKGQFIPIELGGRQLELPIQGLAVLALILIWLYNGEKGRYSARIKPLTYWFYPVHLLVLGVLGRYVL
jgi:hypothetical protein